MGQAILLKPEKRNTHRRPFVCRLTPARPNEERPPMSDTPPVVLVVEDDRELADAYTGWLHDSFTVRTAYRGTEALDHLDDTVDVVLLDRRMPDIDGDEILASIRERELPCRVAMVTAIEPDFDIIEMGFDDYLCKPITASDLRQTVDRLVDLVAYDIAVRDLFQLAAKLSVLHAAKTDEELRASEGYQQLIDRMATLIPRARDQVDDLLEQKSIEWVMEHVVGPQK